MTAGVHHPEAPTLAPGFHRLQHPLPFLGEAEAAGLLLNPVPVDAEVEIVHIGELQHPQKGGFVQLPVGIGDFALLEFPLRVAGMHMVAENIGVHAHTGVGHRAGGRIGVAKMDAAVDHHGRILSSLKSDGLLGLL